MEQFISESLATVTTVLSERGLGIVGAVLTLLIGRYVAGAIRTGVKRSLGAGRADPTLVPFIAGMAYFATMAVVVVMALGTAGFPTASLVAVFGAAGLAIALAFQGTISNFAAGVMLLVFRPISVGHWVEVAGIAGAVARIDVFTTTLNTGDNVRIVVPNGKIFGEVIRNYTANETRRLDLVIGVGYDDDLRQAMEVITRTVTADERVLQEPAFVIGVNELGDSSVNLVVRPWCRSEDYWALRWDLIHAIKDALDQAGLSIPYPQRDVHLFQAG